LRPVRDEPDPFTSEGGALHEPGDAALLAMSECTMHTPVADENCNALEHIRLLAGQYGDVEATSSMART
jgi:hypothetical protein